MKIIFIFLIVLSFKVFACAPLPADISNCNVDADCTTAKGVCGELGAYNKKFLTEIKKNNDCLAPLVKCARPTQSNKKPQAICKQGQCLLVK